MNFQRIAWTLFQITAVVAICTFPRSNDMCWASPPVASSAKTTPEAVMRRYLECWLHGDSKGMWHLLSKETRKEIPLAKFQKNVANSDKNMVKLTRILSVRRLPKNSSPTVVDVAYQVEAKITQKEALTLRKRKYPNAKPGLLVFLPTIRRMVLENGQWLINARVRKS